MEIISNVKMFFFSSKIVLKDVTIVCKFKEIGSELIHWSTIMYTVVYVHNIYTKKIDSFYYCSGEDFEIFYDIRTLKINIDVNVKKV